MKIMRRYLGVEIGLVQKNTPSVLKMLFCTQMNTFSILKLYILPLNEYSYTVKLFRPQMKNPFHREAVLPP
jgi:hypothetical protein